jgi:hypothetical protein
MPDRGRSDPALVGIHSTTDHTFGADIVVPTPLKAHAKPREVPQ